MLETQSQQFDLAFASWESLKSGLLRDHHGKTALFVDGRLRRIFDDFVEAYQFGIAEYGDGGFIVKEINEDVQHLGRLQALVAPSDPLEHA